MIAENEAQEYLDEIRRHVCSRCVERPAEGPPCTPLGKVCGVELHLPQLVEAVRQVHSGLVAPYLECNRGQICSTCTHLHGDQCPCPMDTLAALVVEAIEAVDRRHLRHEREERLAAAPGESDRPNSKEIADIFEAAVGTWAGCDWPTVFGRSSLNLQDWTVEDAEDRVRKTAGTGEGEDWQAAAKWLKEVEQRAEEAETEAVRAVTSVKAGVWGEAVKHARRAWSLEFNTGRPLRHYPATWQHLYEVIDKGAKARLTPDTRIHLGMHES